MCYELKRRKSDTQRFCVNRCVKGAGDLRVATWDEFVMGHPTAGLCDWCAREARSAWSDARLGWTDQVAA